MLLGLIRVPRALQINPNRATDLGWQAPNDSRTRAAHSSMLGTGHITAAHEAALLCP